LENNTARAPSTSKMATNSKETTQKERKREKAFTTFGMGVDMRVAIVEDFWRGRDG